ncbi:unnamed protein product [Pedinophyceae sp. YPF-701]|nr:unnamed protein product [Pedinophyceae sp. YPF-701]
MASFDWSEDSVRDAINTPEKLEASFKIADVDGDGRINPKDAKEFYSASGLPNHQLSQIWRAATRGTMKAISSLEDFKESLEMTLLLRAQGPQASLPGFNQMRQSAPALPTQRPAVAPGSPTAANASSPQASPTNIPAAPKDTGASASAGFEDLMPGAASRAAATSAASGLTSQVSGPSVEQLQAEKASLQDTLDTQLRPQVQAEEGRVQEINKQVAALQAEISALKAQTDEQGQRLDQLGREREAAERALEAASMEQYEARSRLQRAKQEADSLQAQVESVKQQAAELEAETRDMNAQADASEARAAAAKAELENAQTALAKGSTAAAAAANAVPDWTSSAFGAPAGGSADPFGDPGASKEPFGSPAFSSTVPKDTDNGPTAQADDLGAAFGNDAFGGDAFGSQPPAPSEPVHVQTASLGTTLDGWDDAFGNTQPPTPQSSQPQAPAAPQAPPGCEGLHRLKAAEREKCERAFHKSYERRGGVTLSEGQVLFQRAALPMDQFSRVWQLSNRGAASSLDLEGFCLFMGLMKAMKVGTPPPASLSQTQAAWIMGAELPASQAPAPAAPAATETPGDVASPPPAQPLIPDPWDAPVPDGAHTTESSFQQSPATAAMRQQAAAAKQPANGTGGGKEDTSEDERVAQLQNMGFSLLDAEHAVERYGANLDAAADWILSGGPQKLAQEAQGGARGASRTQSMGRERRPSDTGSDHSQQSYMSFRSASMGRPVPAGAPGQWSEATLTDRLMLTLEQLSCDPGREHMEHPYIRISLVDTQGNNIEMPDRTRPAPQPIQDAVWRLNQMQPLRRRFAEMPMGAVVLLEVMQFKQRTSKESVRAWAAIRIQDVVRPLPSGEGVQIRQGALNLKLFLKPSDPTLRKLKPMPTKKYPNRLTVRLGVATEGAS